jgi:hypothetical protein
MAIEMRHILDSYGMVVFNILIDNVCKTCIGIMFPVKMNEILSKTNGKEVGRIVVAPLNIITTTNKLKREGDMLEKGIVGLHELF